MCVEFSGAHQRSEGGDLCGAEVFTQQLRALPGDLPGARLARGKRLIALPRALLCASPISHDLFGG